MILKLENDVLRVEVSTLGAELQSIVGKKSNFEYLWQGDPTYWQNRATVLFPICGRLGGGVYTYQGKTYEMCLHGIAKLNEFSVVEYSDTAVTLEFTSNEQTKTVYPFDFSFCMTYALEGGRIRQTFTVTNLGEGDLPFSFGGHPGFNVPFVQTEKFEDYYLEFACAKDTVEKRIPYDLFHSGKTEPYALRDGKYIDLRHDLFDQDAIFFENTCKTVSLKSKNHDRAVTVHFEDMESVGFWHKPLTQAPYVCIEPWHGCPSILGGLDDFATKHGMVHLDPKKTYCTFMDIIITE